MTHPVGERQGTLALAPLQNAYVLLTITMVCWASNMVVGRAGVGHVPPVALAQLRWTIAMLILLPFAARLIARDWAAIRANLPILALLGFVGIGVYNTLVYIGLRSTSAINASLLASIFPVVVAVFGFVIYRDRLTLAQFAGILIAMLGVAVILSRGELAVLLEVRLNPGDLWVLSAHLAYALYTVMLRERPAIHPLAFLTMTVIIGQALLIPFAIGEAVLTEARLVLDWQTLGLGVYLAVVPAIVAYIAFNKAVALVGSNRAAPFLHLIPIFGSIGAIVLLGERIGLHHVVGWLIVLAGIAATQMGRAPPQRPVPGR